MFNLISHQESSIDDEVDIFLKKKDGDEAKDKDEVKSDDETKHKDNFKNR